MPWSTICCDDVVAAGSGERLPSTWRAKTPQEVGDSPDAADWCRRLREAALKDEEGKALAGAIQTIESFA